MGLGQGKGTGKAGITKLRHKLGGIEGAENHGQAQDRGLGARRDQRE